MATTFTNHLFARSGFRSGMGRVLDLGGTFGSLDCGLSPEVADALALYSDWRTVGGDLAVGLEQAALWEEESQPWLFDPSEVK